MIRANDCSIQFHYNIKFLRIFESHSLLLQLYIVDTLFNGKFVGQVRIRGVKEI